MASKNNQRSDNLIREKKNRTDKIKEQPKPPKKMTGVLFYFFLFLVIFEDILDVFSLGVLGIVTTTLISFVVLLYFYIEGVSFISRKAGLKAAIWIAAFIVELIPFVSMIPTYTIAFLITKKLENSTLFKKINAPAVKKTIIRERIRK